MKFFTLLTLFLNLSVFASSETTEEESKILALYELENRLWAPATIEDDCAVIQVYGNEIEQANQNAIRYAQIHGLYYPSTPIDDADEKLNIDAALAGIKTIKIGNYFSTVILAEGKWLQTNYAFTSRKMALLIGLRLLKDFNPS